MKHQNSIPVLLLKHARWVVIALLFLVSMCVSGKYTQEIFVQLFLWAGLGCCWNLNCGYCKRKDVYKRQSKDLPRRASSPGSL